MDKYEPKYLVHGHVHRNYGTEIPQMRMYGETKVMNAYEYCALEIDA